MQILLRRLGTASARPRGRTDSREHSSVAVISGDMQGMEIRQDSHLQTGRQEMLEAGGQPTVNETRPAPNTLLLVPAPKLRIRSAVSDLPVVVVWGIVAAAAGFAARSARYNFDSPVLADLFAFSTLIAPVALTWAWQEASPWRGTFGKRTFGLIVTDRSGDRIRLPRSLARTGLKLLPWQLAHTAVFGLLADPSNVALVVLAVSAQILVLGSLASILIDSENRALHDWIAGTHVAFGAYSEAEANHRSRIE